MDTKDKLIGIAMVLLGTAMIVLGAAFIVRTNKEVDHSENNGQNQIYNEQQVENNIYSEM